MWKFFRSLFSRSASAASSPELERAQADVAKILKLDLTTDAARKEHNDQVVQVLQSLADEIEKVRQQANNYPANPISGLVWMNGAGYAELGHALTDHFHAVGWLQREENASSMWASATLAVCGPYHHLVGPAMIAYADCHQRLNNWPRAAELFRCVVKDFASLADEWPANQKPNDEERVALESLQTATERLLSHGTRNIDDIDLRKLRGRVAMILNG